ncbi:MAG TPA: hypothetical protein VG323_19275 [Thermoanaerobaculia bacterium]|nr:hypothetical protein [Thermoanaerobaculia bacterium]
MRIGFGGNVAYTVPAKSVAKLTTILLPPGRYPLSFQAEHHVTATRNVDLTAQQRVDAGEVRLRPLPFLTGTVVTMKEGKDVPLAGADVSHLATTDEKGVFRAELPENPPRTVVISHAGVASKTIKLDLREGDTNVGTIRLLPGTALTVEIVRPPALRAKPLTVTLFRKDRDVYEPTRVASQELATADDEVKFADLAPAEHIVVVSGDQPLARVGARVTIEEEKPASTEIRVEPYTLTGRLTFGGDPLGEAQFDVFPRDQAWRTQITTAADGTFGGTAWQRGVLTGAVTDARVGSFFFADSPELGAEPSVWNFEIRKRLISGRVFDAETKEPMGNVFVIERITLRSDHGEITGGSSVRTDDAGNFKVLAALTGRYELRVEQQDYIPKKITVDIAADDVSKTSDFPLERGIAQPLLLRWPDGAPIASATIYDGDAPAPGDLPPRYRSDATGTAHIRGKSGEAHTLYVMPVEGSIAVVHLTIADDAQPVEAVVGRPAGALRIAAVDDEGKPSRGGIILRFNGELIPMEMVGRRYERAAGFDAAGERVLDRLPAGTYEVWVRRSLALPSQPGVGVGISAGEERVRVVVPKP